MNKHTLLHTENKVYMMYREDLFNAIRPSKMCKFKFFSRKIENTIELHFYKNNYSLTFFVFFKFLTILNDNNYLKHNDVMKNYIFSLILKLYCFGNS